MEPDRSLIIFFFFFFNDTATTEIYTLSLHDALPILIAHHARAAERLEQIENLLALAKRIHQRRAERAHVLQQKTNQAGVILQARQFGNKDRKSTRLNSSHSQISYAVFCLKKKNKKNK